MKKKMLKAMSLLAAGAMVMGCLGGCGNDSGSSDGGGSSSGNNESSASSGDDSQGGQSDSAGDDAGASSGEVVDIKWVTVGSGMPDNYDAWKANLDAYLEEKIGVHLDMEVVGWADWGNRQNAIINSGEAYDIMFNGGASDARRGVYMDITDMVQTVTPDLFNAIPKDYWDAVAVNGRYYAIPTYKDSSQTEYFVWDKALAEKYAPNYQDLHTLQDLTEPLTKMMEGEGKTPMILAGGIGTCVFEIGYDNMGGGLCVVGVSYDDDSKKVVCILEQDDVMENLRTLHDWYQKGIINEDANTLGEAPSYVMFGIAQGWSLAAKTVWGPGRGVECEAVQWGETRLSTNTVNGSTNWISSGCKNPEKALQLLELVNTDSYVRDALYFGLEGDNFDYTEDGRVHKNNTDWTMAGYTQGTFFNVTLTDDVEFNQWDEVKALNEAATPSPVLGISIDGSEFEDELANCNSVWNKYKSDLLSGVQDPDVLVPKMMEEFRAAGIDTIIEKMQAQVDAASN